MLIYRCTPVCHEEEFQKQYLDEYVCCCLKRRVCGVCVECVGCVECKHLVYFSSCGEVR